MKDTLKKPVTLQQAIIYFSDPDRAFRYAMELRWPDAKIDCPRCGSEEHSFISTRKIWFCKGCKKQFTVKVGTIFEDSPISLDKWMTAVWMLAGCKNGISSYELAKAIGITQKSAWFMLYRIREAMQSGSFVKMGDNGPIEVDETRVGPRPQKMHRAKRLKVHGPDRKDTTAVVMGMLDRESRQVRAKVVPNVKRETLLNEILNQIEGGSTVYTDGLPAYDHLAAKDYVHATVSHIEEYVRGRSSHSGH